MAHIKVLSSGISYDSLPESYVRPESERPNLSQVSECKDVPLIDLSQPDRSLTIRQIHDACQKFGFFQVINHGVKKDAVEAMINMAEEFFNLPVEEKMKLYSDDPAKTMRLSTSFNIRKEQVHNWRDYLRLHCWPLPQYVRSLGMRLEEAISESLGLEKHYITQVLGEQGQHMAINFYPPCPEPELTYGLPAHTDPNALTILLQDSQVAGLQVLIDGSWLSVKPHPDAFVVNIGDQLQALSNGSYKSIWHRATVNANKPRISVASFLCPADDALISTPPLLKNGEAGSVYKDFTYAEYFKKFWSRNLDQDHCLELFKN
ncbi:hypothetical protein V2J09_005735 [Rumex salicifolius]